MFSQMIYIKVYKVQKLIGQCALLWLVMLDWLVWCRRWYLNVLCYGLCCLIVTSNVTYMQSMFEGCLFDGDISSWNPSSVITMKSMFASAYAFNQDISSWKTGNVTNMARTFDSTVSFNQDISDCDTLRVTTMYHMFNGANSFNLQLFSGWKTSLVRNGQRLND